MDKVKQNFIGTEYSSGDSKMIQSKQKFTEENNNEVDELTKDFSEMGCIVNPDKRPSNVCIETCVYESEGEDQNDKEEDAYSDEFEEDKSEDELKLEPESPKCDSNNVSKEQNELAMKLTNSRSSMLSKPAATVSGRSTSTGSQFVPTTRRVNMSFSNSRLRDIERHNHILLDKILAARHTARSSIPAPAPRRAPPAAAALLRKQAQKKIDHENLILLKKIQRAQSSAVRARR